MKRFLATILTAFCALSAWSQTVPALEQLKADPRKAYGTDYPYGFEPDTDPAITGMTGCTSSWTRC